MEYSNWYILLSIAIVSTAIWLGKGGRSGQKVRGESGLLSGITALLGLLSTIGLICVAIILSFKQEWWRFFIVLFFYFLSAILSIIITIPLGTIARAISKDSFSIKNSIDTLQLLVSLVLFIVGWLLLYPSILELLS